MLKKKVPLIFTLFIYASPFNTCNDILLHLFYSLLTPSTDSIFSPFTHVAICENSSITASFPIPRSRPLRSHNFSRNKNNLSSLRSLPFLHGHATPFSPTRCPLPSCSFTLHPFLPQPLRTLSTSLFLSYSALRLPPFMTHAAPMQICLKYAKLEGPTGGAGGAGGWSEVVVCGGRSGGVRWSVMIFNK